MQSLQNELVVNKALPMRVLTLSLLFLVCASTAGQVAKCGFGHDTAHGLIHLFYLDQEGNVPTFFFSLPTALSLSSSCIYQPTKSTNA
jgi:hypothetical protein